MKTCQNCGGALDKSGKCICCGKDSRVVISTEFGTVTNIVPKEIRDLKELKIDIPEDKKDEIIDAINNAEGSYIMTADEIKMAFKNAKTNKICNLNSLNDK